MISPEILRFVAESEAFYPPDAAARPVAEQRGLYDAYAAAFALPRPPDVTSRDATLGLDGRDVPLRLYRPRNPHGVIVFAHGGGFTLGSRDSHDGIAARIADAVGAFVVAVDYRLAPEHRRPAALDDVFAVVEAVWSRVTPWPDLVSGPLALAGDSAGGTLVAGAALRVANRAGPRLAALALAYPMLGYAPAAPACDTEVAAPMLSLADVHTYRDLYLGGIAPPPGTFPLDAPSLDGFPPTILIAAEHDPLRDDAVRFAERLRGEAGVAAECVVGRGLVHGFLRAIDRSSEAAEAFARMVQFLQEAFERS